MKISSLNQISYPKFQANMGKKALQELDLKAYKLQLESLSFSKEMPLVGVIGGVLINIDSYLRAEGFTHETQSNGFLHLNAGYNGGFYTIDLLRETGNLNLLKELTVKELLQDPTAFGGLLKYKDCIKDLKRQDIIQKGLQIHTYKLDSYVNAKQKQMVAKNLSKYLKKEISTEDLFFIDSEGFYYNKYNKTIYGVGVIDSKEGKVKPVFKECRFETDKKGNVIGYTSKNWNAYFGRHVDETYKEQSEPSYKLSPVVDSNNNKDFAEAFRFGNNEHDFRIKKVGPVILNHLENRVKMRSPQMEDIQYIKFYDSNKNIVTRFGYYDSSVGHSFVYDANGKYLYQMEYIKDDFGNIYACSRL